MEAGAIPVIFEKLRRWPTEADVVKWACIALSYLADGSSAVKSTMLSVFGCEELLREAWASGLDIHDGQRWASLALDKLGFE